MFSRLSKAFPNSQSVEASGCGPCLVETLEFVLKGLNVRQEMSIGYTSVVYTAVKQYLHRMVICLQSEVILHYVKVSSSTDQLLSNEVCSSYLCLAGRLFVSFYLIKFFLTNFTANCFIFKNGITFKTRENYY